MNRFTLTGSMAYGRLYHTATLFDNSVLITGGESDSIIFNTVEIYCNDKKYRTVKSMNECRTLHTATNLLNGKILIIGGLNNKVEIISSTELFDTDKEEFIAINCMNYPRAIHTATLLDRNTVLIVGGATPNKYFATLNTCELYCIDTNRFTETASMMCRRDCHTATLFEKNSKNYVLITGGRAGIDLYGNEIILNTAEVYCSETKKV